MVLCSIYTQGSHGSFLDVADGTESDRKAHDGAGPSASRYNVRINTLPFHRHKKNTKTVTETLFRGRHLRSGFTPRSNTKGW